MTPKLIWTAVAGAAMALAVVLAIGVAELPKNGSSTSTQGGGSASSPPAQLTSAALKARLAGSPRPLAALHAQGGELLGGGKSAWQTRLQALKGWPVVVNKWASWCVPCQGERGVFQQASTSWGKRVAFIGLDSGDTSRGDAEAFLRATPVSYPSYYDAGGTLGRAVTDSSFTPVTVLVAKNGSRFIHQGPYTSARALERDIERYAIGV